MLAQLERHPDVETAEVDRRGRLLRVRMRAGGDPAMIRAELEGMGFAADEAPNAVVARWYGRSSVGELSREEGEVIASRVVPASGAAAGLPSEQIAALSKVVADALYDCFVGHTGAALVPGELAAPCGRAAMAAAIPLIGLDRATALGRAIEADLGAPSGG